MKSHKSQERRTSPTLKEIAVEKIRPAAVNDEVYRPIDVKDAEFVALCESIRIHGIQSPLSITTDGVIVSGHRRYAAAVKIGLDTVPVLTVNMKSTDCRFLKLLVECNRQRTKTADEVLRELAATADVTNAYEHLKCERERISKAAIRGKVTQLPEAKQRKKFSNNLFPFVQTVANLIDGLTDYWPLSVRQVHYRLLNESPLKNASKKDSYYVNDQKSYKFLCDILARARLAELIPMHAISDETRPFTAWNTYRNTGIFLAEEFRNLFRGYSRDLLQSQPNAIELVGEKMTVQTILERTAQDYCVPVSIARGYSGIDARYKMAKRFRESGKQKLVILYVSDFDPEGDDMPEQFARSIRDDFGIEEDRIQLIRVALTKQQVKELKLPPGMKAKEKSSRHGKFTARHGDDVFELESIPPETLGQIVQEAIRSVLDVDLFNAENERERLDAETLERKRFLAISVFKTETNSVSDNEIHRTTSAS